MDHLAQDLSVALEESETCGPINFENGRKWGMRRRTRSAGNLSLYLNKSGDGHSDDSTSSNSEVKLPEKSCRYLASFHQSDSDDISLSFTVARAINNKSCLRSKHSTQFLRGRYRYLGVGHSLESDSFNEHSPSRPNLRRKRKFKRMSVDETPIPPCGKRKRPQRLDIVENCRLMKYTNAIKPLHPNLVNKIEKFCLHSSNTDECSAMEIQCINDECEVASESSLSWSGGEGHEGDDELTDWAPPSDSTLLMDQSNWNDNDPRSIRAGCRRLRDERPGFSINTGANERVARFLQDPTKSELALYGAKREKLGQLAALYSLDLWLQGQGCCVLKKTDKTPTMQPTQRHHSGHNAAHKRIRTLDHTIS